MTESTRYQAAVPAPLDMGAAIASTLKIYRSRLAALVAIGVALAALTYGLTFAWLAALLSWLLTWMQDFHKMSDYAALSSLSSVTAVSVGLLTFVVMVLSWFANLGFCAIGDAQLIGAPGSLGQGLKTAGNRLISLIPAAVLVAIAIAGLSFAMIQGTVKLVDWMASPGVGSNIGLVLLVVLALIGPLALTLAGYWLNAKCFLAFPVMVVESETIWKALARSWRITNGSATRILLLLVLANLVIGTITSIGLMPGMVIATISYQTVELTGGLAVNQLLVGVIAIMIVTCLMTIFTAPLLPLLSQVVYRDRVRWAPQPGA